MEETSVTSGPSDTSSAVVQPSAGGAVVVSEERRFASVRAVQAGRAYFVTACPLRLVGQVLSFDGPDLPPELRAQRVLNKGRVPQIAKYLATNPTTYVLSAITASVDGDVRFDEHGELFDGARLGHLVIPASARILVNDGQHRRAAIARALETNPELGSESVPLVLFLDAGLARSQQIFADLNRHAIRPTTSLNVLYDQRDVIANMARGVAMNIAPFAGLTELEKSSLSNRTSSMFTLSAIHQATMAFLKHRTDEPLGDVDSQQVLEFWRIVGGLICRWGLIGEGRTAADLRREYLHVHGVALHAIGTVGGELVTKHPADWPSRLQRLEKLDWRRANPIWQGRAIQNERISKAGASLILTTNVLRLRVGLELSPTERALEDTLRENSRAAA